MLISIGNHTVFLVQFGINLHEWVFQKVEIARAGKNLRGGCFWTRLSAASQFCPRAVSRA